MNIVQERKVLPALGSEAQAFARAAFSLNTRRAYAAQWRLWLELCQKLNQPPLPAAPETVADWISVRANSGKQGGKRAARRSSGQSISTLRSAVAAIRAAHMANGLAFDSRHPALALVLRGIAREKARLPMQAAPLQAELIREVLAGMGGSALERRDAALLALGYCFARRRAELCGLDYAEPGTGNGVLTITSKSLKITLTRSKGRLTGEADTFVVPRAHNGLAVTAIDDWLDVAKVRPGEPVLRRVHKSGVIGRARLDPQSVSLAIRRRLAEHFVRQGLSRRAAQIEARKFSGHSLRVGFAVTAAEAGADVGAIQKALGHRTPAMSTLYAKEADLARTSPHNLPGVGLGSSESEGSDR